MFRRAIALFLAVLIGVGAIIPLATQQTEAGTRKAGKHAKYKKYSKRWWRQYRARMKRKRAIAAAKRSLRLRQLRMEKAANAGNADATVRTISTKAKKVDTAMLPSSDQAPAGWQPSQATAAELQFRVDNSSGGQIGSASISVVGPSRANVGRASVGGVSTATLRRGVIDKMIKENGWVVNDYEREIAGQQVYVVVAQSQAKSGGGVQSRMFYFTEVDGQVYSVATNSPINESERLAEESEKVINSLKIRVRPTQRASYK